MKTILDSLPAIGIVEHPCLTIELLDYIMEEKKQFNPDLCLDMAFKKRRAKKFYFEVEIFEIVPPVTKKNARVFKRSFDGIMKNEEENRYFFGSEIEAFYELEGPRWILLGAIKNARLSEPTPMIMVYYEKYDESLFTLIISEKMLSKIYDSYALNPMN